MVQPSLRREGFSSIPNVKWVDVGGLDFLRKDFDRYIVRRIQFPEDYEVFCNYCPSSHFSESLCLCLCLCLSLSMWIVCVHANGVYACVKERLH
jgi:hypothetical protein